MRYHLLLFCLLLSLASEAYYSTSPYAWCGNNFVNAIDPDGKDSIYVNDQSERPSDCGIAGETYTATVVVVQNGEIVGEYRGSSYPNSTQIVIIPHHIILLMKAIILLTISMAISKVLKKV